MSSLGLIDHYRIVRGALSGFSAAAELADGHAPGATLPCRPVDVVLVVGARRKSGANDAAHPANEVRTPFAICAAASRFTRLRRRVALHRLCGSFSSRPLRGPAGGNTQNRFPRHRLDEEVRQCPNQRVDAIQRKPRSLCIEVHRQLAHPIFKDQERANAEPPTRCCCSQSPGTDAAAQQPSPREAWTAV